MKKIFSKTLKFKRFTISIFTNEIVIVFIGEKKIFIKTIRMKMPAFHLPRLWAPRLKMSKAEAPASVAAPLSPVKPAQAVLRPRRMTIPLGSAMTPHRKKLAFALSAVIAGAVIVFSLYPSGPHEAAEPDDEMIKKNLLQSKQTDYSSPEKSQKLVITEHRVAARETFQKIAKRYGVSVETIRGTNNLTPESKLRPGMTLKIPNKDGILLKMQKGGELVSIARRYKVSLKKIIDENSIKNPDFVASNTVLFIPDAKPLNIFSGFIWPAGTRFVTCGYGWRRNPWDTRYSEFHPGLDIRSNFQMVKASKYGKVTYTGWLGGYGKAVVIAHPDGYKTLYAHLSRIMVRSGQYVKQGQYIASSGNTGRSTGAHLHFEILRGGRSMNPYIFFRKKRR
ncbi:MAG TPA: M23 family metallopeptidase [Spirochaetota bacterium]|nr:M23 family metallopeptidase [Spirochaetota bacterium]